MRSKAVLLASGTPLEPYFGLDTEGELTTCEAVAAQRAGTVAVQALIPVAVGGEQTDFRTLPEPAHFRLEGRGRW